MEIQEFQERLGKIETRIAEACQRAGRARQDVHLLPVSKTHPPETVALVSECGLVEFGENRVQEARQKIPRCPSHLRWHLIGHLQSNKAKYIPSLFDMVHSVDSIKVLEALDKACAHAGKLMPVTIEVNVAGEGSKFGISPDEAEQMILRANDLPRIEPVGLMTLPPFAEDPEKTRPHFAKLRQLCHECQDRTGIPLPELSMGMTNDFEVAIEEGATWIRIGTGLFGKRGSPWKAKA